MMRSGTLVNLGTAMLAAALVAGSPPARAQTPPPEPPATAPAEAAPPAEADAPVDADAPAKDAPKQPQRTNKGPKARTGSSTPPNLRAPPRNFDYNPAATQSTVLRRPDLNPSPKNPLGYRNPSPGGAATLPPLSRRGIPGAPPFRP